MDPHVHLTLDPETALIMQRWVDKMHAERLRFELLVNRMEGLIKKQEDLNAK